MKKIAAVLLCLFMLLPIMTACTEPENIQNTETPAVGDAPYALT